MPKTAAKKSKRKPLTKRKGAAAELRNRKMFWAREGHPDLDRAGDILLSELNKIRAEARSRGDTP